MEKNYPKEWLDRVPAVVFSCLLPGEIRIFIHPGDGFAGGGIARDVPTKLIPADLRMPNTPLLLKIGYEDDEILRVWKREE